MNAYFACKIAKPSLQKCHKKKKKLDSVKKKSIFSCNIELIY